MCVMLSAITPPSWHDEQNKRHVSITLKPERSPLRLQLKYTPCDVEDARFCVKTTGIWGCK